MHKTPFLHASRIFPAIAAALLLLVLAGCNFTITNLTPDTVPANPSQIYTITASFRPESGQIERDSIEPRIIIDGTSYKMHRSSMGADIWEFDYQLPAGRASATYYFICSYSVKNDPGGIPNEVYSELQTMRVAGRYVIRPEATRAPVGSRVSILGAGFTPADVVYFDRLPTRTVFESPSSLSFFVPAVEPGRNYKLSVMGAGSNLDVGTFRVDGISFQVNPGALFLRQGEQQALTFTIPNPAPAGGMLIDVTTDVSESVIMPEVMVPANSTSVTIPVQGGKPGTGSLFFKSSAGESSVSVTVSAN
ncbi:MAG: cell surface protein [Opitutaceae bacterium]|nr:cell surface protein [Opitutaceae bacterium]